MKKGVSGPKPPLEMAAAKGRFDPKMTKSALSLNDHTGPRAADLSAALDLEKTADRSISAKPLAVLLLAIKDVRANIGHEKQPSAPFA